MTYELEASAALSALRTFSFFILGVALRTSPGFAHVHGFAASFERTFSRGRLRTHSDDGDGVLAGNRWTSSAAEKTGLHGFAMPYGWT